MPITAGEVSSFCDMVCSLSWVPPCQHSLLPGREHGRTIPISGQRGANEIIFYEVEACASFNKRLREPLSIIDRIASNMLSVTIRAIFIRTTLLARDDFCSHRPDSGGLASRDVGGAGPKPSEGRVRCPLIFSSESEPMSCSGAQGARTRRPPLSTAPSWQETHRAFSR